MNNEQTTFIQNDFKYKVVFLGDASVGKTSIVQHIMYGSSKPIYQPTICLESAKKIIVHNNQLYKLMLWDTAGQQKFNSLIPSFVRGCDCAIISYDVSNKNSLQNCQKWLKMLQDDKNQHNCSIILVANKIDLGKNGNSGRVVQIGQGFDLAIKHRLAYVQVSAWTGQGIQNLVSQIIQGIEKFKNKSEKQTRSSQGQTRMNTTQKITISTKSIINSELKIKKGNTCCSI